MTESPEQGRLLRMLAEFRAISRMDIAFGGRVLSDGSALEITGLCGAQTRSLENLRVVAGQGLGGKAMQMGKPLAVSRYHSARGITHLYDEQVRDEQLETVTAMPIVVGRATRLVVYLATRTQLGLGDRWYDSFSPLVRKIEREVVIDDEVRRRLSLLGAQPGLTAPAEGLTRSDLLDISRELTDLAGRIEDDEVRERIERVALRVNAGGARRDRRTPIGLAAREIDVLEQVALGMTNRQVAENLGIGETTAKSYLKNAMRKLHAANRVHAVRLAREVGAIA